MAESIGEHTAQCSQAQRTRAQSSAASRAGMVTFTTVVAMLMLIVLIGFIGNVGHAVKQKLEVQNAADAAALETAQWMARGMNAITATNHMIGEATAVLATLHALGGPEALQGQEAYPPASKMLDQTIQTFRRTAPLNGPPYYVPPPISKIDTEIVNTILKLTTPEQESQRKHRAFATVYDAKITLKREIIKMLMLKSFANIGFAVPPPWGYLSAIAAYAAHVHGTKELVLIGKEWVILEAFERFLTFSATREIMRRFDEAVCNQLVPLLVKHGEFVAGRPRNKSGAPGSTANAQGIVNHAIKANVQSLGERHAASVFVFPSTKNLRLPVVAEPKPSMRAAGKAAGWGNDSELAGGISLNFFQMQQMAEELNDTRKDIKWKIFQIDQQIIELDRLDRNVNELLQKDGLTDEQKRRLRDERRQIQDSRKELQDKKDKLQVELRKLDQKEQEFQGMAKQLANLPKQMGNLTTDHLERDLVRKLINQDEERQTQWVRATYPYVDALRAPLLGSMKKHLERSEAAKHFEKWTNRFTLVKSWEFRSGYRFQKSQGTEAYWTKRAERLHMLVMNGTYTGLKPSKGNETWTRETRDAKRAAESMFTVLGVAHRDFQSHYSQSIYPNANRLGITAFAQAIFYNANPQRPTKAAAGKQAEIGWDTLNWSPDAPTPEWGSPPSVAAEKWPWQMFSSAQSLGSAAVKLNWQSKLMPVTSTRFREAARSRDIVEILTKPEARATLLLVDESGLFRHMVTH